MPIISYFFGIYVRMYHGEHPPPHIHVEYHGHEALVGIASGEILQGHVPSRALRIPRVVRGARGGAYEELDTR